MQLDVNIKAKKILKLGFMFLASKTFKLILWTFKSNFMTLVNRKMKTQDLLQSTTFIACKAKSDQIDKNAASQFGKYEWKKNAVTPLLIFLSHGFKYPLYWEDSKIYIFNPTLL